MIGCIVIGHGNFAPGLTAAVEMIAGKQQHFESVPFYEEESLETFEGKLQDALIKLLNETTGVIIFSDLLGGTPFRTAMVVAAPYTNVEVITGTNLPMLIEIGLLRTFEDDIQGLADKAVVVGQQGIQNPRLNMDLALEIEEDMEGI